MTEGKVVDTSAARKAPVPVDVQNEEPLQVEIAEGARPTPIATKSGEMSLPPTTTLEGDRVTAGQRRVNILWESSQSAISIIITVSVVYCQIKGIQSETLNNAFFFVIATYLQRTNHVRVGGVGEKAPERYQQR